jgi:hypothetical protein
MTAQAKLSGLVQATITPDLLFEAHSSVLDLVFYEGDQFPPEYKGHAFVALKGSWNRTEPTGYKVVRVPFTNGRPEGFYENFATGFWISGERRAEVCPRPSPLCNTAFFLEISLHRHESFNYSFNTLFEFGTRKILVKYFHLFIFANGGKLAHCDFDELGPQRNSKAYGALSI